MLKFENWTILHESLSDKDFAPIVSKVKETLKDLGEFFSIPSFVTFTRSNEPVQQSLLFTNKALSTFSLNYTQKGKLYSVDFWKGENANPVVNTFTRTVQSTR